VFDTSQRAEYYGDVHNLMALPSGAAIRYDYRDVYLSTSGTELAASGGERPILFMYAQRDSRYTRIESVSNPDDSNAPPRFVATRLGRMVNVVRDGAKYYFDAVVAGYPSNDPALIDQVLAPLAASREVPWTKWVSTSDDAAAYARLAEGDDGTKWSAIVGALTQPRMQFENDVFWRVRGPFTAAGTPIDARVQTVKQANAARQVVSQFDVIEHSTLHLEAISDSGGAAGAGGDLVARQSYNLDVSATNDKAITLLGAKSNQLRHYTSQQVDYRVEDAAIFGRLGVDLALSTSPKTGAWPVGPSIRLRHNIRRNNRRVALGAITGALGIVLGILALKAKILNFAPLAPWGDTGLAVAAALLLLLSGYALSGKLELKAPG
jgi:hypothetical protein